MGYDSYAPCPPHDSVGNALVGCVHDLVHHFCRVIEAVDGILAV
jgi:hypothetical protein